MCFVFIVVCPLNCRWSVISKFLDEVQKEKVQFLSGPDKYLPVLEDLIRRDQIPELIGGTAELHTDTEWMKT